MNINAKKHQTNTSNKFHYRFTALAITLLGMVGMLAMATTAQAVTIYQTGFENPPFVADLPLPGQDGWVVGRTPEGPLSPDAAVISAKKPRQGQQSVLVSGANLIRQDFVNSITGGYYDAIGSYRKTVNYDTGGTKTVRVSAHVRVDGRQTTGNDFFSASIGTVGTANDGNASGNGEITISSDGHVYGATGADVVPVFLTSTRIELGEWHNLAVETNFATRKMTFFVDDECLGSFPFVSDFTGNLVLRGSMVVHAAPDTATLHKANYRAVYDQYSIKTVTPEKCKVHR